MMVMRMPGSELGSTWPAVILRPGRRADAGGLTRARMLELGNVTRCPDAADGFGLSGGPRPGKPGAVHAWTLKSVYPGRSRA